MSVFDDNEHMGERRTAIAGVPAANPGRSDDIRRRARERLVTEGAEVGVRVLIELAEDKSQKGSTRGAAAKALVQLSGVSSAATLSEADLAELPADKIRALLSEAQRALDARLRFRRRARGSTSPSTIFLT